MCRFRSFQKGGGGGGHREKVKSVLECRKYKTQESVFDLIRDTSGVGSPTRHSPRPRDRTPTTPSL